MSPAARASFGCAALLAASFGLASCTEAAITEPPLTTVSEVRPSTTTVDTTVTEDASEPLVGTLTTTIVDTHPHDTGAFTQGLEIFDGRFIEGTGLYGESDRRIVDIESGETVASVPIDLDLFGEGITVVGAEILQLTWKAGVLIRSDVSTLVETGRDRYEGEGWGICFDGETLAMSDGSSTLTFRDPETFEPIGTIDVSLNGAPVERLNELECVNGQILANVWLSDLIVVIDPASGDVAATLDGGSLWPEGLPVDDSSFALNGIAHDPDTGHFFLTGKLWPVIYEVELS